MKLVQYTPQLADEWDAFVSESKNGTFLFERRFMDYHSDRFSDCSLLIYEDNALLAVFPANWVEAEGTIYSHQGLTYGGLLYSTSATQHQVLVILQTVMLWYVDYLQAHRMVYKPIPYIYSTCAAQEDLYALFRAHGRLVSRGVSSVVSMQNPLQMRKLRLRGARKAIDNGLYIDRMGEEDWETLHEYWELLTEVLMCATNVRLWRGAWCLSLARWLISNISPRATRDVSGGLWICCSVISSTSATSRWRTWTSAFPRSRVASG